MSQKKVLIPEIGEVLLARRRGARNIRLSITSKGVVRVGLPYWTPYAAGIAFARNRTDWIKKHLATHQLSDFQDGDRIGKAHTIRLIKDEGLSVPASRIYDTEIKITSPYNSGNSLTQKKILEAANRALKKESEQLLPQRLRFLAAKYGFGYKDVRIRSLSSCWGSCSSAKVITLSYYLIQLPWELIDYVLLHELIHTEHLNHGPDFWNTFEKLMPGAKKLRRQVNGYKPRVMANNSGELV